MAKNYLDLFSRVIKNKVFYYTASRYLTYIIQFINSLIIAIHLGPFYLGIWGFINLVIQYILRINFGITNSANTIASIHKKDEDYVSKIIGTAFVMLIGLSCLIILFFYSLKVLNINLGEKYSFSTYLPYVLFIAILMHLNQLFSHLFRVFGKLSAIIFNQSILVLLTFCVVFFWKGESLLQVLIITNCVAVLSSFLYYSLTTPIKIKLNFSFSTMRAIQRRGIYLFLYNIAFYLIIITTKSFISGAYRVEEFGFFTFAYTLANAILLLFETITFLIYPKMLNRFANNSNQKSVELIHSLRHSYITTSYLFIFLSVALYPLFILLFPQYASTEKAFGIIAMSVATSTNSFGYQGLLISRNKEKLLGFISVISLLINIILNYFLIYVAGVNYELVMISTLIAYFIFTLIIGKYGRKELGLKSGIIESIGDTFPIRLALPMIISLFIIISGLSSYYLVAVIILFLFMNKKSLLSAKKLAFQLIKNPKIIDI